MVDVVDNLHRCWTKNFVQIRNFNRNSKRLLLFRFKGSSKILNFDLASTFKTLLKNEVSNIIEAVFNGISLDLGPRTWVRSITPFFQKLRIFRPSKE